MTNLVGLSGYARSGKDSAARVLLSAGWQRISFADKLREFLLALDPTVGLDYSSWDYPELKLSKVVALVGWEQAKDEVPEVRSLLQRCGTEAGREVLGENVWVDAALKDFTGLPPAVVTDVRFPNEARAIKGRGGVVIRVTRQGIGPKVGSDGSIHASETALDDWAFDGVIRNNGTLHDLAERMAAFA